MNRELEGLDSPREVIDRAAGRLDGVESIIQRHATAMPVATAVRDSRASLTWHELDREVLDLSERLRGDGIGSRTPVLLLLDSCIEAVIAYWAVRSIGAIAVIGDPGCTRREFDHYVASTQPRLILATRPGTWARLDIDNGQGAPTPTMRWYLQEGDLARPGPRAWLSRVSLGAEPEERFDEAPDAAVVLFSSGTTGRPKAIVHTGPSITALHHVQRDVWSLTPHDVVLGCLPFHTIYGAIYTAASVIYNGATLVLMERFKPEVALERIEQWRVTTASMVPAMLVMMLNHDGNDKFDRSTLRVTYTGAASISDKVIDAFEQFSGAPLLATYGLTECPGAAVEPADSTHTPGVAGKVCPGFEAVARNMDGAPLAAGETGEITLRGPTMMRGYLGQPELTAQRIRDGWIYTQDVGHVDSDGNIFVSGRAGDMIIRGGLNIAPKEIEDVLTRHPAVLTAVVVGIDDDVYGQVARAYVVPREFRDLSRLEVELRSHCLSQLSRAKMPQQIVFMRELPMNAGGKVMRHRLGESLGSRETEERASSETQARTGSTNV